MPDNTKRYPPELKGRAVRMVFEAVEQTGERAGAVSRIPVTSASATSCCGVRHRHRTGW